MHSVLAPLLIVTFFVVSVGLIAGLGARQGKRATGNIRRMAETLGLQFSAQAPSLGILYPEARAAGPLRGKQVTLFTFSTGSGKSRMHWCAVSARAAVPVSLTFRLRPQGFGTKVMELFGAREIQVGDAAFDRAWFIQTNQPDVFRAALLPELREKINALLHEGRMPGRSVEIKLDQNEVRYAEVGSFSQDACCARCQRAAEIICDLADVAEVCAAQNPAGDSTT